MSTESTQLLVIGGGPGGYVAAIRAAQLGIQTMLVEGEQLGGTCLNIGCIPSKALIHVAAEFDKVRHFAQQSALGIHVDKPRFDVAQAVQWKDGVVRRLTGGVAALLKKADAQVHQRLGRDRRRQDGRRARAARRRQADAPHQLRAPAAGDGLGAGDAAVVAFRRPRDLVDRGAVAEVDAEATGRRRRRLHRAGTGHRLPQARRRSDRRRGAAASCRPTTPSWRKPVAASLKQLGITVHLGCTVLGLTEAGDAVRMRDAQGAEQQLAADQVLVAIGRRPRTEGWGLERLQLDMTGRFVKIDDQCRTSMRNVWAIGDLTGEPMLAHRARAQGEMVAEIIAGTKRRFAPAAIPAVVFTDPEVVDGRLFAG